MTTEHEAKADESTPKPSGNEPREAEPVSTTPEAFMVSPPRLLRLLAAPTSKAPHIRSGRTLLTQEPDPRFKFTFRT